MNEIPDKPLTRAQENDLARAGTEDAGNTLVLHAMTEAMLYARQVSKDGLDQNDLFSLCYDALHRAAKRFQPNRIRFFSYAKMDVRHGVYLKYRELAIVKNAQLHEIEGYDALLSGEITEHIVHPKVLVSQVAMPEYEKIHLKECWQFVKPLVQTRLTGFQQEVVDLYLNGDLTFSQIGKLLGRCRESTRRRYNRAIYTIQTELRKQKLKI